MKAQVKGPILVVAVVAVVAVVVYVGMKSIGDAGSLDHGQIQYTPGKPPWLEKDPNKKGPGGAPGGGGPGASSGQTAPITPGMPVGPPVLNNGSK
jgi:hypothetical protein